MNIREIMKKIIYNLILSIFIIKANANDSLLNFANTTLGLSTPDLCSLADGLAMESSDRNLPHPVKQDIDDKRDLQNEVELLYTINSEDISGNPHIVLGSLETQSWIRKTLQWIKDNPKKSIAGIACIAGIAFCVIYQYQDNSNSSPTYNDFKIYYPSGVSTMNGINMIRSLEMNSNIGKQIEEYSPNIHERHPNAHLIDIDRLQGNNEARPNYVIAECTRFCMDSISSLWEIASGFTCRQISDRVFGKDFAADVSFQILPQNYSTPNLGSLKESRSTLYGHCGSFLEKRY